MSEYISREYLLDVLLPHSWHGNNKNHVPYSDRKGYRQRDREVREAIINSPSADVRPNIHGHWIDNGVINKWNGFEKKEIHEYQCSECELKIYATELEIVESNFCTSCGADMRGKTE